MAAPSSADMVGVYRMSDLSQVFPNARPLQASVPEEGGKIMEHPLETGAQIADHLVIDPTEISFPMVIRGDYVATFAEIRAIFEAGTLLMVQTRVDCYLNMVLYRLPHEETGEVYDAISMTLKFREAHFITPTQGGPVPKNPKHANATKRGQVQATTPATPRGSFLFRHIPVAP